MGSAVRMRRHGERDQGQPRSAGPALCRVGADGDGGRHRRSAGRFGVSDMCDVVSFVGAAERVLRAENRGRNRALSSCSAVRLVSGDQRGDAAPVGRSSRGR